jgi:hypothetical protein
VSYAGISTYESYLQRVAQEFVMTHFARRAAKGTKNFTVSLYGTRNGLGVLLGAGVVSFNTVKPPYW